MGKRVKSLTDNRKFYVYVLFRETGLPFYVGMGRGDRIDHHLHRRSKGRSYKDNAVRATIAALGDLPRVKIATDLTAAEAASIERTLIEALGRFPDGPLLNLLPGGDGPHNLSPEVRAARGAKISATKRARWESLTEEQKDAQRAQLRAAFTADIELTRRALSQARLKALADPVKRERILHALRDKQVSEETRQKQRASALAARARPEVKPRIEGAIRAALSTPEARAANSVRMKARWVALSDSEKAARREQLRAAQQTRWARARSTDGQSESPR